MPRKYIPVAERGCGTGESTLNYAELSMREFELQKEASIMRQQIVELERKYNELCERIVKAVEAINEARKGL